MSPGEVSEAARIYCEQGWAPVPVLPRDKRPVLPNWQNLRVTAEEIPVYFGRASNIGVLLGQPSRWLADIDLDCAEAVELAPLALPPTWCFGRPSKPRSHWLYIAAEATSERFSAPGKVLLELRASGQTVFPPSVHPSGEGIAWDQETLDASGGPLVVDVAELRHRVVALAGATAIARVHGLDAGRGWLAGGTPPPLSTQLAATISRWLGVEAPATTRAPASSAYPGDVAERARRYLRKMPPSISGSGGHVALLLAAEHLVRGFELDDSRAFGLLKEDFNPRCVPPWTDRELEHKVRQAREKGSAVAWGAHLGLGNGG